MSIYCCIGKFKRPVRQGFTLIELLVVISIMALLGAILFPVFGRARENGRRSSCQSNIKQILLGIAQYTQDFDERYSPIFIAENAPGATLGSGNPGEVVLWPQLIYPYINNTQIFLCPNNTSAAVGPGPDPNPPGFIKPFPTSYLGNSSLFWPASPLSIVSNPTSVVLLVDGAVRGSTTAPFVTKTEKPTAYLFQDPTTDHNGSCCSVNVSNSIEDWAAPNPRHLETVVVGFADGHVKTLPLNKFFYGNSPWLDPLRGGS